MPAAVPASGPSEPAVIATVATSLPARPWSGPTARSRPGSRPRSSATISAATHTAKTAHTAQSATVNTPITASSDATVPGRSRSWRPDGRPVIGQSPHRISASGTPTSSTSSTTAAATPRSHWPADIERIGPRAGVRLRVAVAVTVPPSPG